jgi:pimeloyl-ACP methyl ester carboxylesterase
MQGQSAGERLEQVPARPGGRPIPCHVIVPDGPPTGMLLLLHGRDGAGRSPHMRPIAAAYLARGWQVIAPDLPCSRATPDSGPPERFTMSGHLADAATVLAWVLDTIARPASRLGFAGHSVGACSAARLCARAATADHLLAVSPVLSGAALLEARRAMGPAAVAALEREAPAMAAELAAQDAEPALRRITAPVAVITGAVDGITPPRFAKAFFAASPGACFYATLPGQHHCPEGAFYDRALGAALEALGA